MQYYIGIDLGTSSVKSLLMREDGEIIDTAQEGYDIIKPDQQYAQQDMNLLCQAAEKNATKGTGKHTRDKG